MRNLLVAIKHRYQAVHSGTWAHIERVLGWDGIGFVSLCSIGLGLLAMGDFRPAKYFFSFSAVAAL